MFTRFSRFQVSLASSVGETQVVRFNGQVHQGSTLVALVSFTVLVTEFVLLDLCNFCD
eukprot:m.241559 g.241559  ORF g.241559 m.241559 type:complete len:58 (+) comp54426_c0_seq7:142-315(+)